MCQALFYSFIILLSGILSFDRHSARHWELKTEKRQFLPQRAYRGDAICNDCRLYQKADLSLPGRVEVVLQRREPLNWAYGGQRMSAISGLEKISSSALQEQNLCGKESGRVNRERKERRLTPNHKRVCISFEAVWTHPPEKRKHDWLYGWVPCAVP